MTERSSREIERDIADTRSELRETIDAIQEKLSPGQLVDQVLDYFRNGGGAGVTSGASEFAGNLGRTVRQNPMPIALVGLGLGWLMMSGSRDEARRHRYAGELDEWDEDDWEDYDSAYDPDRAYYEPAYGVGGAYDEDVSGVHAGSGRTGLGEAPGAGYAAGSTAEDSSPMRERARAMAGAAGESGATAGERAGAAASAVGEKVRETGQGVRGRARHAAERARHLAEEARLRAAHYAHSAGENAADARESFARWAGAARLRAERLGHRAQRGYGSARRGVWRGAGRASDAARDQADRARVGFNRMLDEQPLVIGAAGLAIGALLGAALPATRREDKWLGETRDDMLEWAEEAAREEWDRAQRVAERVIDTVRTEAEREGISREGAERGLEATEERLRRVAEAARSEAEQQGLSREGIDAAVRAAENKLRRIATAARDAAAEEAKKQEPGQAAKEAATGSSGTASATSPKPTTTGATGPESSSPKL